MFISILAALLALQLQGVPQTDNQAQSDAKPVVTKPAAKDTPPADQANTQRNPNIQVNLIDNNALNDKLGREGTAISPINEFTAVNSDYAVEFGGLGRNILIARPDARPHFHGQLYDMLQNNIFNARTFFQVGPVQKTHRNQYGFDVGGPLLGDRLSMWVAGEEVRQAGYVNGNVLVPLPGERTPRTDDPAKYALISRWLAAYPNQAPNRPQIDPRMLNTNAFQFIRNSRGDVHLDWTITESQRAMLRYSLQDTYINSFQFVAGMNPNQRFRPQELDLGFQEQLSPETLVKVGVNFVRQKSDLTPAPGAVGPHVGLAQQVADLGPKNQFPIYRIKNDFEYLGLVSHTRRSHQMDWGTEIRRYQVNDLQSFQARGDMGFSANFGRTALENLLAGTPSGYHVTLGNLYLGFRNTDLNFFFNDKWDVTGKLKLNLGVRYEVIGAPTEVNHLRDLNIRTIKHDFAPRFGFAYLVNGWVVRGGYGIAFGRIFPATYEIARYNPPGAVTLSVPNPDILNPLGDFHLNPGEIPRASVYVYDANLVAPYTQHYTFGFERQIAGIYSVGASYIGSRTWHLFEQVYGNRAGRPDGIPVTSGTINDRRPDPRYFDFMTMTNMGRAYFDAGQFFAERREGHASIKATYTWSKAIDTGAYFTDTTVNDDEVHSQVANGVLQDMRAPSLFDVRQSLLVSYAFRLPAPGRWLSGWMVTGAAFFHSGTPFTTEVGSDAPPFGNVDGVWNDRPSILDPSILHRSVDHPDTSQSILRPSAFSTDDNFLRGRGNIGRNVFRKDGGDNINLALSRSFTIGKDTNRLVTFRAETLNLTNHPQFDAPNNNVTSTSFGKITNTVNAGRVMQFVLNVKF